jgi:nucleotide-binding universal stress UspA family protein
MDQTKLYCPVYFSESANNAVEYAANFAKDSGASLTLVYYESLPLEYSDEQTAGVLKPFSDQHKFVISKLNEYAASVREQFKIECHYAEEFFILDEAAEANSSEKNLNDMIIMGTNGADTLYQFYFGSNSYRFAKRVKFPVLIIPDQCSYSPLTSMIYISDFVKGEEVSLKQLINFLGFFKMKLKILHVAEKDTELSRESFRLLQSILKDKIEWIENPEYEQSVSDDMAISIEKFAHSTNPDIIAISMKDHDIVYRLFHEDLIKKLSSYVDYPFLILHK